MIVQRLCFSRGSKTSPGVNQLQACVDPIDSSFRWEAGRWGGAEESTGAGGGSSHQEIGVRLLDLPTREMATRGLIRCHECVYGFGLYWREVSKLTKMGRPQHFVEVIPFGSGVHDMWAWIKHNQPLFDTIWSIGGVCWAVSELIFQVQYTLFKLATTN